MLEEPEHQHSKHIISFHLKKTNERVKVIEHIPDTLTKVFHGLTSEFK